MEMFLTALSCQEPAALSGLSDEHKHLNTPRRKAPADLDAYVRSSAALADSWQDRTVRNIPFLRCIGKHPPVPEQDRKAEPAENPPDSTERTQPGRKVEYEK